MQHASVNGPQSPTPRNLTYSFMRPSICSMRYATTPSGPTLTCSPVGIACVLIPGIVSRAICWISACSSGVHCGLVSAMRDMVFQTKGAVGSQSVGRSRTIDAQNYESAVVLYQTRREETEDETFDPRIAKAATDRTPRIISHSQESQEEAARSSTMVQRLRSSYCSPRGRWCTGPLRFRSLCR